jgi:hypothetical protein
MDMLRTMPKLKCLALVPQYKQGEQHGPLELSVLCVLPPHCPHLESLSLPITANSAVPPSMGSGKYANLSSLTLLMEKLENPLTVAFFLSSLSQRPPFVTSRKGRYERLNSSILEQWLLLGDLVESMQCERVTSNRENPVSVSP